MVMDSGARIKRARKAAKASAKIRTGKVRDRNRLIILAHAHLTGNSKSKAATIEAIKFLQLCGNGVNHPDDGTGALLFLAKSTGLTKQRIWAIVKGKKG